MKKIGIYVHIPFCKSKCKYCNFVSYVNKETLMPDYIQSVVNEIEAKAKEVTEAVDTIYIGGGTPSFLAPGSISTILNAIFSNYKVDKDAEISIECNPNSVNYTNAQEWINSGVNRVSIGLQTIKQSLLNIIGRSHSKQDYINAIEILDSVGFTNINADIMIGLPKQKISDVRNTILAIHKKNVNHISCYSLIVEKDTPLFNMINNGEVKPLSDEKTINMYAFAYKFLNKLGYKRYEVSNFAVSGYECKHNTNCWNLHEYLGFGASAHGFYNGIRYSNVSSIEEYISKINKQGNALEYSEEQTLQDKIEEYIMLGLRLANGIDLVYLKDELKYDLLTLKKQNIDKLLKLNLIEIKDNKLFATDAGFYVLNSIIVELV